MKVLLDTHTLLWFLNGDQTLSASAKESILNRRNVKFVSIVSIWEIFIKVGIGKLDLGVSPAAFQDAIQNNGFNLLSIEFKNLHELLHLPFHHKDPFDRLIIAQAQNENMTIITKDENFARYKGTEVLW